jgi:hypothetical protein
MIYDSYDIIPIKIFFKIEQTKDVTLLDTKKKKSKKILSVIWDNIKEQRELSNNSKKDKKVLNLSKEIEVLFNKYEATRFAVFVLQKKRAFKLENDAELINLLKNYGYTLHLNNYDKHLTQIYNENEELIKKIEDLRNELPEVEEDQTTTTLEKIVLSYSVVLGLGFVDVNTMTCAQYDAHILLGNEKLKSLQKNG